MFGNSFHHYIPRPYRRKREQDGIYIDKRFHEWIHRHYTNEEIALWFNDYGSILNLYGEYRKLG